MTGDNGLHPALQLLVDEHRVIERVIAFLQRQADAVAAGETVDPAALRDGIAFMRRYADARHHGKEEDALFQLVRARDPGVDGIIEEIMAEHVEARGRVSALAFAVEDFAEGRDGAGAALADAVGDIELLYAEHIEREDTLLFPMIADVLDPAALDDLAAQFRRFDADMAGDLVLETDQVAALLA